MITDEIDPIFSQILSVLEAVSFHGTHHRQVVDYTAAVPDVERSA